MRVIGVLDLSAGRAVHARAGRRDEYTPVAAAAGVAIDGDAVALARVYRDRLAIEELYAADLDAIVSSRPQAQLVRAVAAVGCPLWLDAGVRSGAEARQAQALGAAKVVVGLETLVSYGALAEACASVQTGAIAFSLDLRNGDPILQPGMPKEPPEVIAARAEAAGIRTIVALDLASVGMAAGFDLALIDRLRRAAPGVELLAGGGVGGADDLARLGDAGCDGALVATALLDGRLGAAEIRAARARQPSATR
jgi:phosphoribosylformimino-5-aminoimidazole carboxamide ribotide isomerase